MSRDPDFGALLMVGMGGVFVEVYKDVAFRLVPVSARDVFDMIGEIRAQPLLDGARKRPVLDRAELTRFTAMLRERLAAGRALQQACLAAACGWIVATTRCACSRAGARPSSRATPRTVN